MYKTLNNYEKIDFIAKPELYSILRGQNFSYKREQTKFTPRQEFLQNRAVNNWNYLSMKTVNSKQTWTMKWINSRFDNRAAAVTERLITLTGLPVTANYYYYYYYYYYIKKLISIFYFDSI